MLEKLKNKNLINNFIYQKVRKIEDAKEPFSRVFWVNIAKSELYLRYRNC